MELIQEISSLDHQEIENRIIDMVDELRNNPAFKPGDEDRIMDEALYNELVHIRERGLPKTTQEYYETDRFLLIFQIAIYRNVVKRRVQENDLDDGFDF